MKKDRIMSTHFIPDDFFKFLYYYDIKIKNYRTEVLLKKQIKVLKFKKY